MLWENFEVIAEAENGIQRLRDLILNLAMCGKVAPPQSGDDSAIKLKEKLKVEKENFAKELSLKKSKFKPTDIDPEFISVDIPEHWQWIYIGDFALVKGGKRLPKGASFSSVPTPYIYVRVANFKNKSISDRNLKYIDFETREKIKNYIISKDDLYISIAGTIGKVGEVPATFDQMNLTENAARIIYRGIVKEFLIYVLNSKIVQAQFQAKINQQAQPKLALKRIETILIPLPPFLEQQRIVKKVDELMELCDRAEASKKNRNELQQQLRRSAIHALETAETEEDFKKSWHFVRDNFSAIVSSPNDVQFLRNLTVNFAVRGRLVPQNPNEQPATELLNIIADKHKSQSKKFRKPKNVTLLEKLDKPFKLPSGWSWCRFTDIGQFERGRSRHRPRNDLSLYKEGFIPFVQTGDIARAKKGLVTSYTALYNQKGLEQSRLWLKGTLCITIAANIAESGILSFDACFPDSIVGFVPTEPIEDARYFEFFIRTLQSQLENFAPATAQRNINLGILDEVIIPLPPLEEQKRIVSKVDELMKCCDRVEESLRKKEELASAISASVIHHLEL